MILMCCVDDQMGLQFNRRRQSKDAAVRQRMLELAGGALRVSPFTARQFEASAGVYVGDDYLSAAKDGQSCFCEDLEYLEHAEKIEKIILFRWNRLYPSDLKFQFPGSWRLEQTRDFPGTSHETITMEVYDL